MAPAKKNALLQRLSELVRNGFLWKGIGAIVVVAAVIYVLMNSFLMPMYTRHGVSITVPDVLDSSFEEAAATVREQGLKAELIQLRKPNLARNVVIDQNPLPNSRVKPGRRVYLTVNSGDTTTVVVPKVSGFSIREARNRIMIQGLAVENVFPDTVPSLHANTITRQEPKAGERIPPGEAVTLWYSTGLGDNQVLVPNVIGRLADEAQQFLLNMRLRSVVIGDPTLEQIVKSQSPIAGTSVREGFEIRLRLTDQ